MPYDINQMYIHDSPENLSEIKQFYLTLEKPPSYPFLLNEWQKYVRYEMDKHLFSKITYNKCNKKPLYFNAFVLLAWQLPYAFIEIKEFGYLDDQTRTHIKCCCSQPISCIFWMKGPHFKFLTGCTCIDKTKLIPPTELKKVKDKYTQYYINTFRPYFNSIVDVLNKNEIRKQENKNIFILALTNLLLKNVETYEKSMIQFRLENKKCIDCGAKSGKFDKCLFCVKRCKCGKVILDVRWDACTKCNFSDKSKYPDICSGCKNNFNSQGKYTKCYNCNKKN